MRELLGVLVKDLPRYVLALARNGPAYLELKNRMESLTLAPDGSGYRCEWQWTSDLAAPKALPILGCWLMKRAVEEHPMRRLQAPMGGTDEPQITFVVGHRGIDRLPHLLATLESIAGQLEVEVECIVVEQDSPSRLHGRLPKWVRHVHTPPPTQDLPYCRSWAFNVGARNARGNVLVLHDNDILVPADYAAHILRRIAQGYDVVNLKRFIFYLNETHTQEVLQGRATILSEAPDAIMQNAQAGGSIAVSREGFERIGGMDEAFIGWGGEDNDFWERAQSLSVWSWGCMPMVHLWHAPQHRKQDAENPTAARYRASAKIAPADRIRALLSIPRGREDGPSGWTSG